jgi:hypothetical protein
VRNRRRGLAIEVNASRKRHSFLRSPDGGKSWREKHIFMLHATPTGGARGIAANRTVGWIKRSVELLSTDSGHGN